MKPRIKNFLCLAILFGFLLSGCNMPSQPVAATSPTTPPDVEANPVEPEATPQPLRRLTICMGQEPASLFLYADGSLAARNIRQAIYDDPVELVNLPSEPAILEKIPSLSSGEILFDVVSIQPGGGLVDAMGNLVVLSEGVAYFPPGCNDFSCVLQYTGTEPLQMEQQVIRFTLRDKLVWSDGSPLNANDSTFSYEIAQALAPNARADILPFTNSYSAINERTIEWRSVPGYRTAKYLQPFFAPLPRHAWGQMAPKDLSSAEVSAREPIGYGPYLITEWAIGNYLTLVKNPNYHRASEGLPVFDELTFRFMASQEAALSAFQAGECDILDDTLFLENQTGQLTALQEQGLAVLIKGPAASWEHLDFGIASQDPSVLSLFQAKETRQAAALCVDRKMLAESQGLLYVAIPDSFIPPEFSQASASIRNYGYDPVAGGAMLDATGWLDTDGDPKTARNSQTVNGFPDGTALSFSLTVSKENQALAAVIKEMLAVCGFDAQVQALDASEFYQPGPGGTVFGRNFQSALFSWIYAQPPACQLYSSSEIPGNYPQYIKGWTGANITGYSNTEYDQTCRTAMRAPLGSSESMAAIAQTQQIFAEDLPVIPLFARYKVLVTTPEICGLEIDPGAESSLWNVEMVRDECAP